MKRIVLTPGEPAGIGPELTLQIAQGSHNAELIAIADPVLLQQRASELGLSIGLHQFDVAKPVERHRPGSLCVWPVQLDRTSTPGVLDPDNAAYVLQCLREAVDGCLRGDFAAMVTGPVQKSLINEAGIPFSGHTEYLAGQAGGYPVMMLATSGLRVALVTTHLPLAEVSRMLTRERLSRVVRVLNHDLKTRFRIEAPQIHVCGLNPHAGEGGHLGREEIDVMLPVLEELRREGINLIGPSPADTVFTPKNIREADAVLAMYHDQGLPVLKHMGFGNAVNITLGLPIIRTSVDHGTALELAGTGKANAGSLEAAIKLAIDLSA